MSVYSIRLIGPWEFAPLQSLDESDSLPDTPGRVKAPVTWAELFGDWRGTAQCVRKFNSPTSIDEQTRIEVAVHQCCGRITAALNNEELMSQVEDGRTVFDVSGKLRAYNALEIQLTVEADTESKDVIWSLVTIDIHE